MKAKVTTDEVSLSVLWRGFGNYKKALFKSDLVAALSVALLSVPLSMAYALVAGLPASVGLLATIFGTLLAAAFGSSRHLIIGPSNTIAILLQAGLAEILYTNYRGISPAEKTQVALVLLMQITFLAGLFQFLAGALKLGRLTHFISRSVVTGYVIGAALAIIFGQLYNFFGVAPPDRPVAAYEKASYFISHIHLIHWPTAALAFFAFCFFFIVERISRKIPAAVLMLAAASLAAIFMQYFSTETAEEINHVLMIKDYGETPSLAIKFSLPFFDLHQMNTLLPISFAIALLGILEATSIARTFATSTGQVLSVNQEIFALGASNLLSSTLGAMPSSGSFARSALNFSSGAKTRMAAVLSSVFVAIIVISFFPLVLQIPLGALAALLFITASRMIKWQEVRLCIKATATDAFVLVITALSCIIFSVDIAFYIGIVLSILFYLRKAATPRFIECRVSEEGEVKALTPQEAIEKRPIRILQVDGELFFAAADLLHAAVKTISQSPEVKVIILKMTNAFHLDATACAVLHTLVHYTKSRGSQLILTGLTRPVWQVLSDSGFVKEVGSSNLFLVNANNPSACILAAYYHAEGLTNNPPAEVAIN
jgi:SulP family sulfate permease